MDHRFAKLTAKGAKRGTQRRKREFNVMDLKIEDDGKDEFG